MKVLLTYFKPNSGTYYSEREYESLCAHDHEIYSEVRTMRDKGILPGLVPGAKNFDIHVLPSEGVPALITLDPKPNSLTAQSACVVETTGAHSNEQPEARQPRLETRDWDEWEKAQFEKQFRSFRSLGDGAFWAAVESSVHWNRMYAETMERERNDLRLNFATRKRPSTGSA